MTTVPDVASTSSPGSTSSSSGTPVHPAHEKAHLSATASVLHQPASNTVKQKLPASARPTHGFSVAVTHLWHEWAHCAAAPRRASLSLVHQPLSTTTLHAEGESVSRRSGHPVGSSDIGAGEGAGDGAGNGAGDGAGEGSGDGARVGVGVGIVVGANVGLGVGGRVVGSGVGAGDGAGDGAAVGGRVVGSRVVGAGVGDSESPHSLHENGQKA